MRNRRAESELLTPAEAIEHCPGLDPEPFVAATYNPDDGFADPNLAVQGYTEAARKLGVDIRTKTAVTDLHREGDRVVGADIQEVGAEGPERHEVDCVVNAAGAWAATIGGMAGVDLPIAPRRRQISVVDPTPPVPESVPLTIDLETGSYFRPERDGVALVGGHFDGNEEPDQDPNAYDEGWMSSGRRKRSRMLPTTPSTSGSTHGLNAVGPGCTRSHPIATRSSRRRFPA